MENTVQQDFNKSISFLQQELQSIRAGRANPELLEKIIVVAYGQQMPLKQLASISATDARTLLIQPWDTSTLKDIEKSIIASDLGMNPVVDGKTVRLVLPQMTEERRQEFVKIVRKKAEETKISLRRIREEAIKSIKESQKEGVVTEDELARETKNVQDQLNHAIAVIDDVIAKKTEQIVSV